MSHRIGLLLPTFLFFLALQVAAAEVPLVHESSVLVLRNGSVLRGTVDRAGDQFIVRLAGGGEVRVPRTEVRFRSSDLEEAHRRMSAELVPGHAGERLELVQWCLRHGLLFHAAEHLRAAAELDPGSRSVQRLERRLRSMAKPRQIGGQLRRPDSGVAASPVPDSFIDELPSGVVEAFATTIQPLLLNRCSGTSCHGARSKSKFRLHRSPWGNTLTRRFTERNLLATLQMIDRDNPRNSPLLTAPRGPHGSAASAIFDPRGMDQYRRLVSWSQQVARRPAAALPTTIEEPKSQLLQTTGGDRRLLTGPSEKQRSLGSGSDRPAPRKAAQAERRKGFVPKDPFDPEIFNRRYLRR